MNFNDLIKQSKEGHLNDQSKYSVLLELLPEKISDINPKELGCALWTIFSQNNEVHGKDGKELIEGSWRWWGGYIADYLNTYYGTDFNYLDFYCSSYGLEHEAPESHINLLRLIMQRIKELGWTFYFSGPRLGLMSITEPDEETIKFSLELDKINALQEAENTINPPLIVKIAHEIGVLDN